MDKNQTLQTLQTSDQKLFIDSDEEFDSNLQRNTDSLKIGSELQSSTESVESGFVLFENYESMQNIKDLQIKRYFDQIEKRLELLDKKLENIVNSIRIVQTEQSQILMRMTNTLIRSGVAFPFIAQSR